MLDRLVTCISVLDISGAALARAQVRLGPRKHQVRWIEADVTGDWPVPSVEVIEQRPDFLAFPDPSHKGGFWLIVARKPRQ